MDQQPQYEPQSEGQDKWTQQPTQKLKAQQSSQFEPAVNEHYTTFQFQPLFINKKQLVQKPSMRIRHLRSSRNIKICIGCGLLIIVFMLGTSIGVAIGGTGLITFAGVHHPQVPVAKTGQMTMPTSLPVKQSSPISLSTTMPTPTPKLIPSPTLSLPLLLINPASFNANTNCTYNTSHGWTCIAFLNQNQDANFNLAWIASSTNASGITFNPSSGTLYQGQTQKVIITIANTSRPIKANFIFSGRENTIVVPWSCGAPILTVYPSHFIVGLPGCVPSGYWNICPETLAMSQNSQGILKWSASSNGLPYMLFTPKSGILSPGQTQFVHVSIPYYLNSGTISFIGPGNTANAQW
jgi:hypothetical protein